MSDLVRVSTGTNWRESVLTWLSIGLCWLLVFCGRLFVEFSEQKRGIHKGIEAHKPMKRVTKIVMINFFSLCIKEVLLMQ